MQEFVLTTTSGSRYAFPFSRAEPPPCKNDRVTNVFVDAELGSEAFTYFLESGKEGSVHLDHVREYNEEPEFMANLLLYHLTLEAEERVAESELSLRQIARQLNTSVPQLYRLLDPANYNKSMKQLVALLHLLNCDVDLVVKKREAA